MHHKPYYYTVSTLFTIVAILHFIRAIFGWDLIVEDVFVPAWISWVAAVLVGYLAIRGFMHARSSL